MSRFRLRDVVRFAIMLGSLCVASFTFAHAQSACCKVLTEPAIEVKDPSHVDLIAIARAGDRLVAVGEHGVIIYSDDNGQTWRQASVPVDVTLTAVEFATSTDGWAVGHYGIILHSADGGVTWREQLDGNRVNELTMAAAKAAVASNSTSPGAPLAMRRAQHFLDEGPAEPFLAIWAQDANNAIVFGAYRMAVKTTDGGKTWTDWSLHIGDPLSHNLYDVSDIGTDMCIGAETGLIFCSSDNGETFTKLAQPGNATLLGMLPTGNGGILAFGVAGYAYRSEDGGKTWANVDVGAQANLSGGIVLPTGGIVVVDQAGSIHVSRDHAQTFRVLAQSQPMSLYGLVQAANGDIVVVGSGGARIVSAGALN
jgi:photosystem II stability/assembly factor-like uncharacterized protein